jgi:hypothetical protein
MIDVDRRWVKRERREEHVVHVGHSAPYLVDEALADFELLKKTAWHRDLLRTNLPNDTYGSERAIGLSLICPASSPMKPQLCREVDAFSST